MILPILNVKDVDASVAFFKDKLGFNHDFSMEGPDGKNGFAFVSLGKATIGLSLDPANSHGGKGVQFMIYVPDESNLDDYFASVKGKMKVDQEIADQYWGDRTFTIHDPEGHMLTFAKTVKQVPMDEIREAIKERL